MPRMLYGPAAIHAQIASVCPIDGVAIGDPNDPKTWRIDFAVGVTPAQIAAAQQALAVITSASLAQADATVQAAAAAIPDPLATAKTQAIASLPSPAVGATGAVG